MLVTVIPNANKEGRKSKPQNVIPKVFCIFGFLEMLTSRPPRKEGGRQGAMDPNFF